MNWYEGTYTLIGVIIGTAVGLIIDQLPVTTAIGIAGGAWIDGWLHNRKEEQGS